MRSLKPIHRSLQRWLEEAGRLSGKAKLQALDQRFTQLLDGLDAIAGSVDLHELLSLWMLLIQDLASQAGLAQASDGEKLERLQHWTAQASVRLIQRFGDRSLRASDATQLEILTVLGQHLVIEEAAGIASEKILEAAYGIASDLSGREKTDAGSIVAVESFVDRARALEDALVETGGSKNLRGRTGLPGGSGARRKLKTYFATFRNCREYKNPYLIYGNTWTEKPTFGVGEVSIPLSRKTYALIRDPLREKDRQSHKYIERGRYFVLESAEALSASAYFGTLEKDLAGGVLMVFVHGFRQTHADALIHAAQIFHDLALTGAPLVLSWPSGFLLGSRSYSAAVGGYGRAVPAFAEIIRQAAQKAKAAKIVLIGHSLGCRVLGDICQSLELTDTRYTQLILASPDIEVGKFKAAIAPAVIAQKKVSVYASRSDRALQFASWLYEVDRAGAHPGQLAMVSNEKVEVVATEGCFFEYPDFWRHSDFSCGAALDVRRSLNGESPQQRELAQRRTRQGNYWAIS
jgi:esterase/lipase superfamily enzyme